MSLSLFANVLALSSKSGFDFSNRLYLSLISHASRIDRAYHGCRIFEASEKGDKKQRSFPKSVKEARSFLGRGNQESDESPGCTRINLRGFSRCRTRHSRGKNTDAVVLNLELPKENILSRRYARNARISPTM